ncbi:MAG: hypothetical protein F4Z04_02340 [Acidobacteria bacterium]|nr:hypothetical protein [Acidobacteriota bacterium]
MGNEQRLPGGRIVYDPRGTVTAAPQELAPRLESLAGIRLGVLDNTKWNASQLLRETVARLQEDSNFAEIRRYAKESFSRTADPELLDRIARETDAVITAIGD